MPFRILVVEDDSDCRELLREHLLGIAMDVREAETAEDAFVHLRDPAWRPTALLIDVGLPNLDGVTLLSRIRKELPCLREVPAIAITAYDQIPMSYSIHSFAEMLPKPFDFDALETMIVRVVRG